jgi:anionic cell wall polymer biosynthesis LytR-Cps2A-Psr (LCP) family protein
MYMSFIKTLLSKKESARDRRRRSNWYIYLISFALTCVMLGLFIIAFQGMIFPDDSVNRWDANYVPDAELDTTILFMMSDAQGSVPDKFVLFNYRPRDEVVWVVPLNSGTRVASRSTTGSLTDLYRSGGAELVMEGIKTTLGVECEFFVTFDRASFMSFAALAGDISVSVTFPFIDFGLALNVGEHLLSGGDLFIYMTHATDPDGNENFHLSVIGRAVSTIVNSNLRHMDDESINAMFNRITNNASTNLTFSDFATYQRALSFTSNNSVRPAGFYVPTVTASDNGTLTLSPASIANIHTRFGLA